MRLIWEDYLSSHLGLSSGLARDGKVSVSGMSPGHGHGDSSESSGRPATTGRVVFVVDAADLPSRSEEVMLELGGVVDLMEDNWVAARGGGGAGGEVVPAAKVPGGGGPDGGDDVDWRYTPPLKCAVFFNKADLPHALSGPDCLEAIAFDEEVLRIPQGEGGTQTNVERARRHWIKPFRGSVRSGDGLYEMFEWIAK